jgi:hypothetical protein
MAYPFVFVAHWDAGHDVYNVCGIALGEAKDSAHALLFGEKSNQHEFSVCPFWKNNSQTQERGSL